MPARSGSDMPPFDENLNIALDALYSAFGTYPEPASLEGSPYKNVAGMFRSLRAAPLRELTGDQIGPYAGSALLTVGGLAEYKHYLPRIVEQAVLIAPHVGTDPPIIAERLKRASWRTWPQCEQVALRSVFHAAWSWAVEQPLETGVDASGWLCGIAALEEPVLPVLTDWGARSSTDALLHAASLGMTVENLLSKKEADLAYWSYVKPELRLLIAEWVTGQDRIKAFRAGLEAVGDDNRWYIEQALSIAQNSAPHQGPGSTASRY